MVVEDEEQREKVGFRKIQDIFLIFFQDRHGVGPAT